MSARCTRSSGAGFMAAEDRALEQAFPWIEWRKPVLVSTEGAQGYVCRYCIARYGLRADQLGEKATTLDECTAHIERVHPLPTKRHRPKVPSGELELGDTTFCLDCGQRLTGFEDRAEVCPVGVVHVARSGRAVCGTLPPGPPEDWPRGHVFVDDSRAHESTCEACRAQLAEECMRLLVEGRDLLAEIERAEEEV